MKRVLYAMPAVMVAIFYGMLALLAGSFASFQLRAWLMVLMPALSAVLLLKGKWWGCIPSVALGALLVAAGLAEGSTALLVMGGIVAVYYLVMGIVCRTDAGKNA